MRILITGCKGQLGLELIRQLNLSKGVYELIETDIHNLDITDQSAVLCLIDAVKPDAIINCAAYTNVDNCETDEANAFLVNAIGARNLSVAAFKVGAKILQISTDYVFKGEGNIPKKEYDAISPINCYGRSKAMGERLIRETNPRHFIVRTAWLYGQGKNFVRTMLELAKQRDEISVVNDQFGTPTSTVDLARCITELLSTEGYGTYHATCEGECSWHDFAVKIFELSGMNIRVNGITSEQLIRPAQRPKYAVLDNFMLKVCGLNTFRYWEESLEEYINIKSNVQI